jgi:Trp operon repressor
MEMLYQVQENTKDIELLQKENLRKDEIITDLTNRVTILEDLIKEQQSQSINKDKENFTGYPM